MDKEKELETPSIFGKEVDNPNIDEINNLKANGVRIVYGIEVVPNFVYPQDPEDHGMGNADKEKDNPSDDDFLLTNDEVAIYAHETPNKVSVVNVYPDVLYDRKIV